MLLGGFDTLGPAELDFIESVDGYIEGSAQVEAIYPGREGREAIIQFEVEDPVTGSSTCIAVAEVGVAPSGYGCSGGTGEPEPGFIPHLGYSVGPGSSNVMVEHSSNATATVVELTDGTTYVVRPAGSTVSFLRWDGAQVARVTVFWPDGSSQSRLATS